MAYTPVPMTTRVCVQCNRVYYAKDKRRLYCSSSCNTRAWMARVGDEREKIGSSKGDLNYSLKNLAMMTAGSLVADAVQELFSDQPTNQEIMTKLASVEKQLTELVTIREQLRTINTNQVDQIKAEMIQDPGFKQALDGVHQARLSAAKGPDSLALKGPTKKGGKTAGR